MYTDVLSHSALAYQERNLIPQTARAYLTVERAMTSSWKIPWLIDDSSMSHHCKHSDTYRYISVHFGTFRYTSIHFVTLRYIKCGGPKYRIDESSMTSWWVMFYFQQQDGTFIRCGYWRVWRAWTANAYVLEASGRPWIMCRDMWCLRHYNLFLVTWWVIVLFLARDESSPKQKL